METDATRNLIKHNVRDADKKLNISDKTKLKNYSGHNFEASKRLIGAPKIMIKLISIDTAIGKKMHY